MGVKFVASKFLGKKRELVTRLEIDKGLSNLNASRNYRIMKTKQNNMRLATGVHELEILKQMTILNKWNLLSLKFESDEKRPEKEKPSQ